MIEIADLVPRPSRFGLAWPFVCLTYLEWPAATRAKSHERQSGYEIRDSLNLTSKWPMPLVVVEKYLHVICLALTDLGTYNDGAWERGYQMA